MLIKDLADVKYHFDDTVVVVTPYTVTIIVTIGTSQNSICPLRSWDGE